MLSELDLGIMHVLLLDYCWVIIVYTSFAFWLAVLIDGKLLRPFEPKVAEKQSTIFLLTLVFSQIALQGFIALIAHSLLSFVPSPVQGLCGYDSMTFTGECLRNPAIITVILFFCSASLQQRLLFVFKRFDRNAK